MKILLMVANVDWFFISHRLCIAQEAARKGWKVFVATEDTGRRNEIEIEGITFIDFKFSRSGTNPIAEINTLIQFKDLYKKIKPDVVHHITLKPVIYGGVIAKIQKIKGVVNAVSGLGYNFTGDRAGFVQKLMIRLMRFGFKRSNVTVIFQNKDDYQALLNLKIVSSKNNVVFIKGSGVNLENFNFTEMPPFDPIKVLFPVRMLWDKGTRELREASELLRGKYENKLQFILAGLADSDNKAGVSAEYLNEWQDGKYVIWVGYQKNLVSLYKESHIVILPSYREGMPKTLIEACSAGRAIVTTDAIGCRECVEEGINGFKVPVYSISELAQAIEKLVQNPLLLIKMGVNSRRKAVEEFDVKDVINKHLEIYAALNIGS